MMERFSQLAIAMVCFAGWLISIRGSAIAALTCPHGTLAGQIDPSGSPAIIEIYGAPVDSLYRMTVTPDSLKDVYSYRLTIRSYDEGLFDDFIDALSKSCVGGEKPKGSHVDSRLGFVVSTGKGKELLSVFYDRLFKQDLTVSVNGQMLDVDDYMPSFIATHFSFLKSAIK